MECDFNRCIYNQIGEIGSLGEKENRKVEADIYFRAEAFFSFSFFFFSNFFFHVPFHTKDTKWLVGVGLVQTQNKSLSKLKI